MFIYIEDAIGTLKNGNGETATVIVPSGSLQISKPFEITAGDPVVNFVYDVTVVAAGNEYVLLPQVDQSGPHQSHYEVGEGELTIQVGEIVGVGDVFTAGHVTPGQEITVLVFDDNPDNPVEGATVTMNDVLVSQLTDGNGEVTFTVPADVDELEIKVELGNWEGEREWEFDED